MIERGQVDGKYHAPKIDLNTENAAKQNQASVSSDSESGAKKISDADLELPLPRAQAIEEEK